LWARYARSAEVCIRASVFVQVLACKCAHVSMAEIGVHAGCVCKCVQARVVTCHLNQLPAVAVLIGSPSQSPESVIQVDCWSQSSKSVVRVAHLSQLSKLVVPNSSESAVSISRQSRLSESVVRVSHLNQRLCQSTESAVCVHQPSQLFVPAIKSSL
jgi:hypothetical protein